MVPASKSLDILFVALGVAMLTAFGCGLTAIDASLHWFGGQLATPLHMGIGARSFLGGPLAAVVASAILVLVLLVPGAIRRREIASGRVPLDDREESDRAFGERSTQTAQARS